MALDTIIYPQAGQFGTFGYDYAFHEDQSFDGLLESTNYSTYHHKVSESINASYWRDYSSYSSSLMQAKHHWDPKSSPEDCTGGDVADGFIFGEMGSPFGDMKVESPTGAVATTAVMGFGRRKRRRTKSGKNKEELENQRMTHIKVERNRRKQMNEYLAIIRSLMPSSYVQRSDQASIVGGAINFVKELEQQLQTLEVQKRATINSYSPPPQPFGDFFAFPQYSSHRTSESANGSTTIAENHLPAMAEIEVTMVESQANIKVLSKKRHRQLLKVVAGLQYLWLSVLHLNVTTVEEMVLYTLSVKLEDRCQLSTVDEIADAVNCLLCKIEEESLCS